MNPDTTHSPDSLPPRDLPRRRSGRHRNPLSFDSSIGTPVLVLAVPGRPDADGLGQRIADLVAAYRPEVTLRVGYLEGDQYPLSEALSGLEAADNQPLRAVVVPLTTVPHQPTLEAISAAIERSGAHARIAEGLGPHPMLAEVMHLRLAEAGFVRADRMRLISVVTASAGMADGVVIGAVGGADAVNVAGVTAVLLAARLGVTVLPAALDDMDTVHDAFAQLRQARSQRPVLAPCVLGTEPGADTASIAAIAHQFQARYSEPLGANTILAKIVALRYAELLNEVGVEEQPTLEELPAPVGMRHRRES